MPVSVLFVMKQHNHCFLSFVTGNDIMGCPRNPGHSGSPVICDKGKTMKKTTAMQEGQSSVFLEGYMLEIHRTKWG